MQLRNSALVAAAVATSATIPVRAAFGTVAMDDDAITFTKALTEASFSDLAKVVLAADSTVTFDGVLVFMSFFT